ncbi:MAG: TPM domain-containing protein [Geitlerinemataceae cyanobacterium]
MQYSPSQLPARLWSRVLALGLAAIAWFSAAPAHAFDNPELLPDFETEIVDLADILTSSQEELLTSRLERVEEETGFKLRVLTQFDRTPGRAVIKYWGLDDKSVLLVADQRGGNLLAFSVGDELYELMPRTFWIELQTRFGNQFFVRDNGEDQSIFKALGSVEGCIRDGGCDVVPGLPREQWILTLITSAVGGVVCGFAAQPRDGQTFAWQWALIFSPLWGILFFAFGIGPVVTRTSEVLPLVRNVLAFVLGLLVAYLTPFLNQSPTPDA